MYKCKDKCCVFYKANVSAVHTLVSKKNNISLLGNECTVGLTYLQRAQYFPLGYERVYLPLCEKADTPFHIQGDEFYADDQ